MKADFLNRYTLQLALAQRGEVNVFILKIHHFQLDDLKKTLNRFLHSDKRTDLLVLLLPSPLCPSQPVLHFSVLSPSAEDLLRRSCSKLLMLREQSPILQQQLCSAHLFSPGSSRSFLFLFINSEFFLCPLT